MQSKIFAALGEESLKTGYERRSLSYFTPPYLYDEFLAQLIHDIINGFLHVELHLNACGL